MKVSETDVKYFYLRDIKNSKRVATIVRVKSNEDFYYSLALCNPADKFTKKLGRRIALGRLRTGFWRLIRGPVVKGAIVEAILSDIVASCPPGSLVRMAKDELEDLDWLKAWNGTAEAAYCRSLADVDTVTGELR